MAPLETSTVAAVEAVAEPPVVAWAADDELYAEPEAVQLGLLGTPAAAPAHADATATTEAPQKLAAEEASIPADFFCPITSEIMEDPVVTADGHTYERKAITAWLAKSNTSPMTGVTLETTSL